MYLNSPNPWRPLDRQALEQHRNANWAYSLALMALLAIVPLLLAAILGGPVMVLVAVLVLVFLYFNNPLARPEIMERMLGGTPIPVDQAPDLYALVTELAERAQLPAVPKLIYLPSRGLNAMTTGPETRPVIALSAGLLHSMSRAELTGILAHEISHIRGSDIRLMQFAGLMNAMTGWLAASGQLLVIINLPLYLVGISYLNWWIVLLLIVAPGFHALCQLALSRTREYDADAYAAQLLGDPAPLISALTRLEYADYSPLEYILGSAQRKDSVLLSTHPPTRDRIERLRDLQVSQPLAMDPAMLVSRMLRDIQRGSGRDSWF